jgi:hypothetical protein
VKDRARYVKTVEWSDEDHCFLGSSPGLIYGGCHGDDERAVFDELCRIVEDAIDCAGVRAGRCRPPPQVATSPTRCRTSHSFAVERTAGSHSLTRGRSPRRYAA